MNVIEHMHNYLKILQLNFQCNQLQLLLHCNHDYILITCDYTLILAFTCIGHFAVHM